MDSCVNEKHVRSDRRSPPSKPDSDAVGSGLASSSSSNPADFSGFNKTRQNPCSNPILDRKGYVGYTETQLEEKMLNIMESGYNKALARIVELGYDENTVKRAILRSGHCNGSHDVFTNVYHNTLSYLNSLRRGPDGNLEDTKQGFDDLSQLIQFSLAYMVCLVRRSKPYMQRIDAIWLIIMCNLHVGRACKVEISDFRNPKEIGDNSSSSPAIDNTEKVNTTPAIDNTEKVNNYMIGVTPDLCKFHGGWGLEKMGKNDFPVNCPPHADSEETLQRDTKGPNWSALNSSKKLPLQNNVVAFAAEYRASLGKRKFRSRASSSSLSSEVSSNSAETEEKANPPLEPTKESLGTSSVKNQTEADKILKKLSDLNLEGDVDIVPKDKENEMLLSLVCEIMDLENQVKERKEWAHQKAMQAARKLSHDLTELKMLRMGREEYQKLKQEKQSVDDPTMKTISEMEDALRKASGEAHRVNLAVRHLEVENAEIRAEIEASKLSASESMATCLEVAKREKKYIKKLLQWEKQRGKLQDDIAAEKEKVMKLQEEMTQVEAATKTAEAKLKEEQKAKEQAQALVEEEKRLKEATEANIKRNYETLCSKIELDFQRYKDDLQRLENELSQIKTSTRSNQQLTNPHTSHPRYATIDSMLYDSDDSDEKHRIHRSCIICEKKEVSVVFLPCAHQVLCACCNEEHEKKGKTKCPTCSVPIEERIHVFGVDS